MNPVYKIPLSRGKPLLLSWRKKRVNFFILCNMNILKNDLKFNEGKGIYTLKDLAKMFQVTIRTMYNWMEQNRFSFVKIGSKTYVTEEQLQEFLKKHSVKSFNVGGNW